MIRFHNEVVQKPRGIRVERNTTDHAVVAEDSATGRIMKLGRRIGHAMTSSIEKCTKIYGEGNSGNSRKSRAGKGKSSGLY